MPSLKLADLVVSLDARDLLSAFVPPRRFRNASFDEFAPDPAYPSQAAARERVRAFAERRLRGRWRRRVAGGGLYLDGGFGVGKTHLLAAAWNASLGRRWYGSFLQYTALVGAMGMQGALSALSDADLICIDEFDLDDPGDTLIMCRILREVQGDGARVIATSNTPPEALGEGRFAARDFLREIQSLASRFDVMRIEGRDRRRRSVATSRMLDEASVREAVDVWGRAGVPVVEDTLADVSGALSRVHPARYAALASRVGAAVWHGREPVSDPSEGLRLVAFIDRLYDADCPVAIVGVSPEELFDMELRAGPFARKYGRAISRLAELAPAEHV